MPEMCKAKSQVPRGAWSQEARYGQATGAAIAITTRIITSSANCDGTVKTLYKNPLFQNLSPYPGGIHKIQVASTLRTLGYPSFGGQVLNFLGSFPHQGKLESKTKFPNPPYQQTICPSKRSVC